SLRERGGHPSGVFFEQDSIHSRQWDQEFRSWGDFLAQPQHRQSKSLQTGSARPSGPSCFAIRHCLHKLFPLFSALLDSRFERLRGENQRVFSHFPKIGVAHTNGSQPSVFELAFIEFGTPARKELFRKCRDRSRVKRG